MSTFILMTIDKEYGKYILNLKIYFFHERQVRLIRKCMGRNMFFIYILLKFSKNEMKILKKYFCRQKYKIELISILNFFFSFLFAFLYIFHENNYEI